MDSSYSKLLILAFLFMIQGIPYGIQDKFIPVHLFMNNVSYTNVSLMKFLFVPWVCKGIWAPFIQVYFGPYIWLLISVGSLGAVSFWGSTITVQSTALMSVMLLLLNFFSAVQDVVVDGWAIRLVSDSKIGLVNSIQVVMYKVGSLFGGTFMIYVTSFASWRISFVCLSAVYFIAVLLLLFRNDFHDENDKNVENLNNSEENLDRNEDTLDKNQEQLDRNEKHLGNGRKSKNEVGNVEKYGRRDKIYVRKKSDESVGMSFPEAYKSEIMDVKNKLIDNSDKIVIRNNKINEERDNKKMDNDKNNLNGIKILSILKEVSVVSKTPKLILFVLIYKMGERAALNNFPLYLLGMGVTPNDLALWNGFISQVFSILGSFFGGLYVSSRGSCIKTLLRNNLFYRSLTIFILYAIILISQEKLVNYITFYYLSMAFLVYLNYSAGVISTLTFTYMMKYSKALSTESQATHYSLLSSLEVAGKLFFASSAGFIIDSFSISSSFCLFSLLSLLSVFVV